mgnify:CR=1 FL=1
MRLVKRGAVALGLLLAAGAAVTGALLFTGGAGAQTPPDEADGPASRYEALLAQRLGISVEDLKTHQKGARDAVVDEMVADGRLTAEQGERLKERPLGDALRPGIIGGLGDRLWGVFGDIVGAAADVIGISEDEVRDGIADGKSLTELAEAQNLSRDELKSGLVTRLQDDIEAARSSGELTDEQADRLSNALEEHVDRLLDGKRPFLRGPEGFEPGDFELPGRPFRDRFFK